MASTGSPGSDRINPNDTTESTKSSGIAASSRFSANLVRSKLLASSFLLLCPNGTKSVHATTRHVKSSDGERLLTTDLMPDRQTEMGVDLFETLMIRNVTIR
jgi:hypothetical protein